MYMDKALKQRLVGASVLIALAVVVLPMLLGSRPNAGTQGPEKIELPQQPPELSFETRRYPIGESQSDDQGALQEDTPTETVSKLPSPRSTRIEIKPSGDSTDSPVPEATSEESLAKANDTAEVGINNNDQITGSAEEAQTPDSVKQTLADPGLVGQNSGRYVVQVASFGALDNANRLSSVLSGSGYSVLSDSVKSDIGILHRVRVGPYDTETEANQVMASLESTLDGVKPRVMDLQPEQAAQVVAPVDPLVRWVVQVASFSNSANAENLVATLRLEGQSAYQESVNSSGSELYRVRVGPFLERDQAIQAQRRVAEKLSLAGVVMSAD
jgi:DedD protein